MVSELLHKEIVLETTTKVGATVNGLTCNDYCVLYPIMTHLINALLCLVVLYV